VTTRPFLTLPDGTLRAPWRLLAFGALTATVLSALAMMVGLVTPRPPGLSESAWIFLAALVAAHVVMVRRVDHLPWGAVGLGLTHAAPHLLGQGIALGAVTIGVPSVVLLGTGLLRSHTVPGSAADWWRYAGRMTTLLLPAALWEELAFRGYPFAVLRRAIGAPAALLATSVLFGVAHAQNLPSAGVLPLVLVGVAGMFLGAVLLVTGSLWATWMTHFAWNWVMAALLHTEVSGVLQQPPDYRVVDAGPAWLTGGVWGPEGGIPAGLGMATGLAYLVARRPRAQPTGAAFPDPREHPHGRRQDD
jgi:membrane protease YdiL (CAAX protease family)